MAGNADAAAAAVAVPFDYWLEFYSYWCLVLEAFVQITKSEKESHPKKRDLNLVS